MKQCLQFWNLILFNWRYNSIDSIKLILLSNCGLISKPPNKNIANWEIFQHNFPTMYRGDPLIVCVSSSLCKYCANPKSVWNIKNNIAQNVYICFMINRMSMLSHLQYHHSQNVNNLKGWIEWAQGLWWNGWVRCTCLHVYRSMSIVIPASFRTGFSLADSNKFCGLRSIWAILFACKKWRARAEKKSNNQLNIFSFAINKKL